MSHSLSLDTLPNEALIAICYRLPYIGSRDLRALQETCTVLRDVVNYCYQKNLQIIIRGYSSRGTQIDLMINSIRYKVNNPFELDSETISKIQQHIVQIIRSIGFRCPSCHLSLRDISQSNLVIENMNLQKAWGRGRILRRLVNPAGLPGANASAAEIRAWMTANQHLLQGITELDLSNLELTCVPKEIGLFTGLEMLDLSSNNLTQLPKDLFATLTQLQKLFLGENKLTHLPEGLFASLIQLQKLCLDNNNLTQLPKDLFATLTQLEILNLSENKLTHLPEGLFASLTQLKELDLSGNELKHLPEGLFASLTQLERLYLSNNQLTQLPENLFAPFDDLRTALYLVGNMQLLHVLEVSTNSAGFSTIREFESYQCQSAFAQFYKDVAQCKPLAAITTSFGALDKQSLKIPILEMIFVEADADGAERHAFDDMPFFCGALKRFVKTTFDSLSDAQKNAVYDRVDHAGDSVLALIDAMAWVLKW